MSLSSFQPGNCKLPQNSPLSGMNPLPLRILVSANESEEPYARGAKGRSNFSNSAREGADLMALIQAANERVGRR